MLLIITSLILLTNSRKKGFYESLNICNEVVKKLKIVEEEKAHRENFLSFTKMNKNVDPENIKDLQMKIDICEGIISLLKKDLPQIQNKQDDELHGLSLIGRLSKKISKKSSSSNDD